MAPESSHYIAYKYNPFTIIQYLNTLSPWRRILARFFTKFKITKKEYDEWFDKNLLSN